MPPPLSSIVARPGAIKMRRVVEFCALVIFIVVSFNILSRSQFTPPNPGTLKRQSNEGENLFLPQPELPIAPNVDSKVEKPVKISNGLPELAKYIHLDLKGAPPQASKFYASFFGFINKIQMGVKGVLLEYEDTLPLQGKLANATHRAGYSRSDIELIQKAAKAEQIEVIPLIQTFGHLEWLLKLREYELYRDDLASPMVITPCINATYVLLEDLLQQTLDMHPNSNIIHIGCDEVTLTNSHPQCREESLDVPVRYIRHVHRVVNIVKKIRPNIRVLIWDDVIRSEQFINNEALLKKLKDIVEPVAWNYRPELDDLYTLSPAWNTYSNIFSHVWAASAFKGGLTRYSMITNTTHHVLNNQAWLNFMQSSKNQKSPFAGIILTGWSRFDHFMPLCDLLPTAYPSLISSLNVLSTGKVVIDESIDSSCDNLMEVIGKDPQLCELLPGRPIRSGISSLFLLLTMIDERLSFLHTVAPAYNRAHSFVRRSELDSRLGEMQLLQDNLNLAARALNQGLSDLYSLDIVDEWLALYVTPTLNKINTTLIEFWPARNQTSWPRRPLI